MSVYEKLMKVQGALKAPKEQKNNFGNYKYRSCEDILEALKPILADVGAVVTVTDRINLIGDRYYIESIASFIDVEDGKAVQAVGYAREAKDKKGMDDSQLTGATSSYARKYALNGLFAIDNTEDMDKLNTEEADWNKEALYKKAGQIRVQGGKYESFTLLEVEKDNPDAITEWYRMAENGERKQILKAIIDKRK